MDLGGFKPSQMASNMANNFHDLKRVIQAFAQLLIGGAQNRNLTVRVQFYLYPVTTLVRDTMTVRINIGLYSLLSLMQFASKRGKQIFL